MAKIPTTPAQALAAWRYVWPVGIERVTPLRRVARLRAVRRAGAAAPAGNGPPTVLVAVYRQRNTEVLEALLRQTSPGTDVRLWALDEIEPALADATLGSGAGSKFTLLNKLLTARTTPDDAFVVVADDDVCFAVGDLAACLAEAARYDLDLFQPSHAWSSIFTYPLLLHRPRLAARRTTFVECGPLFVVGPRHRSALLPLPEDLGMGWGIEAEWFALARNQGVRLGVIDSCRIVHVNPVGVGYDRAATKRMLEVQLDGVGRRSVYELQTEVSRWPL